MQRRHDPTYYWATQPAARSRAARDPRPLRLRPHRGRDRRRPGPARRRRGAPCGARRLGARAERGLRRRATAHPVSTALVDAGARHDLPLDELRTYMGSMRVDCAPVRIRDDEELDRYMDGSAGAVGRIMAPLLGAPERRERGRAPRHGLPADELHPRRARGLGAGPHLPARACPRATCEARPRRRRLPRARRAPRSTARGRCSARPRDVDARGAAAACATASASRARSTAASSTASSAPATTCSRRRAATAAAGARPPRGDARTARRERTSLDGRGPTC